LAAWGVSLSGPADHGLRFDPGPQNMTCQVENFFGLINDGGIAGGDDAGKSDEDPFGDLDSQGITRKMRLDQSCSDLFCQFSTSTDGGVKEKEDVSKFHGSQNIQHESKGTLSCCRLFEVSRKTGDVPDESIISKNEGPTAKACLDGDQHVMPVNGKVLAPEVP